MKRSTTGFPVLHYLPGVCSTSCPLSQWCHLTNSSSAALFSFFPQSFPASGSFSMNQLFASDGQSIGASASLSVLPINIQGWFPLGLISFRIDLLTVQGTLKSLLQNHNSKASILWHSVFFMVQFSHLYKTTGKTIALITQTFVGKVMSLLFNMLSRLAQLSFQWISVFQFHGCSQHPQWFWSPRKWSLSLFPFFPIYLPWSDGTRCHDLSFLNAEL